MANLAERVSLIVRSSVSDLLSKLETNPTLIDTAIADEKVKYAKIFEQSKQILGQESIAKRTWEETVKKADKEHELAAKALKAGNEEDAKTLLGLEQDYRKKAEVAKMSYEAIKTSADTIRKNLNEANANIKAMEAKATEIKAKMVATKAINQTTGLAAATKKIAVDNNLARFANKAEADFEAAKAGAEFIESQQPKENDIEAKYADNSGDDSDELLANLKAELGK